jgi:hypothetical protein
MCFECVSNVSRICCTCVLKCVPRVSNMCDSGGVKEFQQSSQCVPNVPCVPLVVQMCPMCYKASTCIAYVFQMCSEPSQCVANVFRVSEMCSVCPKCVSNGFQISGTCWHCVHAIFVMWLLGNTSADVSPPGWGRAGIFFRWAWLLSVTAFFASIRAAVAVQRARFCCTSSWSCVFISALRVCALHMTPHDSRGWGKCKALGRPMQQSILGVVMFRVLQRKHVLACRKLGWVSSCRCWCLDALTSRAADKSTIFAWEAVIIRSSLSLCCFALIVLLCFALLSVALLCVDLLVLLCFASLCLCCVTLFCFALLCFLCCTC